MAYYLNIQHTNTMQAAMNMANGHAHAVFMLLLRHLQSLCKP